MPLHNTPVDFIAYDADGSVLLLAEAKSRHGTSEAWAAKLRSNMLSHGTFPPAKYFLIATPERMYGWGQESVALNETHPQFTIDAKRVLEPYFTRLNQKSANISPKAFELLILTWLTDVARSGEHQPETDASRESISEFGLLSSLKHAQIELNQTR